MSGFSKYNGSFVSTNTIVVLGCGFHSRMSVDKHDNVRVIRVANPICRRMTERGKAINAEYSIFRDQPVPGASSLQINALLHGAPEIAKVLAEFVHIIAVK